MKETKFLPLTSLTFNNIFKMISAKGAQLLSEHSNDFDALSKDIQKLAFRKFHDLDINLSYPPYQWIEKLGFEGFREVMTSFGYEVFNNKTKYKIRW